MSLLRFLPLLLAAVTTSSAAGRQWVGTWTTAPQLVEPANMPPSPGLANNTLRQIVRVSIGGDTLRMKFTNDFSQSPTVLQAVTIARSTGSGAIDATTSKTLTFQGKPSLTLAAQSSGISDPVAFPLAPRTDLAISIRYGQVSSTLSGHPGSRTTSYLFSGDKVASVSASGAVKTEHWYTLQTIEVRADAEGAAVAILGNSITDGRGSTTDQQNRWPDVFAERLRQNTATRTVGVLNLGIGGNCVVAAGGLGATGVERFSRDILAQNGVRWLVIAEGVNDIGQVKTASDATAMATKLTDAYASLIAKARAQGMLVYGATILPFKGNGYYNAYSEACRGTVNRWIRATGHFDGVIDFDKAFRSSSDTAKLSLATYQNDGLHPDAAGYQKMGQFLDLQWFVPTASGVSAFPARTLREDRGSRVLREGGSLQVELGNHRADGRPAVSPGR